MKKLLKWCGRKGLYVMDGTGFAIALALILCFTIAGINTVTDSVNLQLGATKAAESETSETFESEGEETEMVTDSSVTRTFRIRSGTEDFLNNEMSEVRAEIEAEPAPEPESELWLEPEPEPEPELEPNTEFTPYYPYDQGDVYILGNLIFYEVGVLFAWCEWDEAELAARLTASCLMNRANMNFGGFGYSLEEQLVPSQYATWDVVGPWYDSDVPQYIYDIAEDILLYGPEYSERMVYQAAIPQGDVIYYIYNTYFGEIPEEKMLQMWEYYGY